MSNERKGGHHRGGGKGESNFMSQVKRNPKTEETEEKNRLTERYQRNKKNKSKILRPKKRVTPRGGTGERNPNGGTGGVRGNKRKHKEKEKKHQTQGPMAVTGGGV